MLLAFEQRLRVGMVGRFVQMSLSSPASAGKLGEALSQPEPFGEF
jgi:hypothetical protein